MSSTCRQVIIESSRSKDYHLRFDSECGWRRGRLRSPLLSWFLDASNGEFAPKVCDYTLPLVLAKFLRWFVASFLRALVPLLVLRVGW